MESMRQSITAQHAALAAHLQVQQHQAQQQAVAAAAAQQHRNNSFVWHQQAAAAGKQQKLSARRLRAAPARDGRASRAAATVPRARVPRLAHLVLPSVPAAGKRAL